MAQHRRETLVSHYLVLCAVHQHGGCRRRLPLGLALAHHGTRVGHHGGRLPAFGQHGGLGETVGTAVVELQHRDGTRRAARQHHALGVDIQLAGMVHHPRNGCGAVLGGNVDHPLEQALHLAHRAVAGHLGAVLQAQAVVGAHHRIAARRQQLRNRGLQLIVALAGREAAAEEGDHAGLVAARYLGAPHVEPQRRVALHIGIRLLHLCPCRHRQQQHRNGQQPHRLRT